MNNLEMDISQEKIGKTGLVVGKFYPPHNGHDFLINKAASRVENLDVIVIAKPDEIIPGELRAKWVAENHPNANVILRPDTIVSEDSERWADQTVSWLGYAPDIVFSSEDYGDKYAHFMGSKHFSVDRGRTTLPISGTAVRQSPLENLHLLEPNVRAHFVKRVCVLGAESTGTTTLSRALAKHYNTLWVPEYGRKYSEKKYAQGDRVWNSGEFEIIAREQQRQEDDAARLANKVLICDTNAFVTEIFHELYMGNMSEKVAEIGEKAKADLYIVTDVNIPFVQDGLREGGPLRTWMHKRFIDELKNRNFPYIVVEGEHSQRMIEAISMINHLLEPKPVTH